MTTSDATLCIRYHDVASRDDAREARHVLARIGFGDECSLSDGDELVLTVGLPELPGRGTEEHWLTSESPRGGRYGDIHYRSTADCLFGAILLSDEESGGMQALTADLYRQIGKLQQATGYRHLLRIWHYFPGINRAEHDLDRYQAFCVGRYQTIDTMPGYERQLPAASAIGTHGRQTLVYFLAAREPGIQVENPRQVSAFHYPEHYSPRSPTFSRAVLKSWGEQTHLYVSGTASIVGHETRHPGDQLAQLDECLVNIEALVRLSGNKHGLPIERLAQLSLLKVYLRHPADLAAVSERLRQRLGESLPVLFLHGDICRSDLLLEVEGLYDGVKC